MPAREAWGNRLEKGDGEQEMRNRAHRKLSWKEMAYF